MDKKKKEIIIFIISLIIIFLGARGIYRYITDKKAYEYDIRREQCIINSFQNVIQYSLDDYVKNEKIIAMADTDSKMKAYKTLDEIIDASFLFDQKRVENPDGIKYDSCLEKNIRDTITKYVKTEKKAEDGRYIFLKAGKKYQVWVLIQGSYKDGFTVLAQSAKTDPFSEVR